MFRMYCLLVAVSLVVGLGAPPAGAEPSLKISLSREDPDVRSQKVADTDFVEFFLWIDGIQTRGLEAGLVIEGGQFLAYVIDTSKPWIAMPLIDPYPATISQVVAGDACHEAPCYFGRILVRPDEPGGKITVNVVPSERSQVATIMNCFNQPSESLRAYPAAVNAVPDRAYQVRGEIPGPGGVITPREKEGSAE